MSPFVSKLQRYVYIHFSFFCKYQSRLECYLQEFCLQMYTCNLSAANFRLLSIFAAFPRYYLQESRMFCLLTMKDDENVHPVKLILCQCEKIIKLILCLIFHLLPSRITEISLRKTNISLCLFDLLDRSK